MNLKNIKILKEKDVLPKWYLDKGHSNFIVENMPLEDSGRCMPYFSYPIPNVEDLCVMLTDYAGDDEIAVKIDATLTTLGHMMYSVVIKITAQDTIEKEFDSPFLDDALVEALIALKENKDEKEQMYKDMENA